MLDKIKKEVYEANMDLAKSNLVILTWGNVSERIDKYIVIKPSGIKYTEMKPRDMVVLDIDGNIVEGNYNPSSDTPTHLELYKSLPDIKGIVHTHSNYATSFAQAGLNINCLGTTHADYFYGAIPCTRVLTKEETETDYEKNTGKVIVETFKNRDYISCPGVLVNSHGIFAWGNSANNAVQNAIIIEELAKMNYQTLQLKANIQPLCDYILNKHYTRKHGENAYYGQIKK